MSTITTKQRAQSSASNRMTVDEFERYADSQGDERIELIDGHVIGRGEMKPAHVLAMGLVKLAVEPMLPNGRFIRKDEPVRIPDFNEPFPDLAVAHGDLRTYADRHPGPEDISLVIEISDTTLDKDQGPKWANYARARIPIYWIVNLIDRQIEVYTEPSVDGYGRQQVYKPGEDMPVVLDGALVGRIAVSDIFA